MKGISRVLPTKFRFIWPSGFREEDFLEINQSETRMACGGQVNRPERNQQSLEDRAFNIFQVYQYFTIYRWYFYLKFEQFS
jgi:hypothetical protein